jgi:hypothetical protein
MDFSLILVEGTRCDYIEPGDRLSAIAVIVVRYFVISTFAGCS